MSLPSNVKKEFIPHQDLFSTWNFVKLDTGEILGIRHMVTKCYSILDDNGMQRINQFAEKEFYLEGQVLVKAFSKEEYERTQKQRGGFGT